jgi:hypothetical protein
MRSLLAALLVCGAPLVAVAQETRLPIISSPLAPIGLPLPSPGPSGRDPWIMGPHRDPWIMTPPPPVTRPPKVDDDGHGRRRRDSSPVVVYVPQYVTVVQTVAPTPPPSVTVNVVVPAPEPRPAAVPAPVGVEPPAVAKPTTFYFIPGCYMGNIPPEQMKLPAGCDLTRLVTRSSQ